MNLIFEPALENAINHVFSTPDIIQQHEWELRCVFRLMLDELKAERTVELGSWKGYTGALLSLATAKKTVSIDSADFGRYEDKALQMGRNLVFVVDDCRIQRGVDAVMNLLDGSIDFLYVDDSHTYPDLSVELEIWRPHVRAGGMIAFHDINPLANIEPTGDHSPICQAHKFWSDLKGDKMEIIATQEHRKWRGVIPHGGIGILRV